MSMVLAFALGACAMPASSPQPSAATLRPLIVDVDMDSSDVLALAYVLNVPGYDVQAITVPGTGIGTCPRAADNARAIAVAVGRGQVPVACGGATAVGGGHPAPDGWRIPADDLYGIDLPDAVSTEERTAPQLIVEVLRANPGGVDILAAGPMTNVALALIAEPSLHDRVRRVVTMAGAVAVPGNVDANPEVGSPEWNVWADPAALAAVVSSGVPVVLVPLDATNDVPVTDAFFARLASEDRSAAADIAFELLARNRFLVLGGQYFWDPLAAAVLEDPGVVALKEVRLRVGSDDPAEMGRTVLDDGGFPVQVAVSATTDRFDALFLAGLRRSPERGELFAPGGRLTVTYDGSSCVLSGADDLRAAPYWVAVENVAETDLAVALVTLHPGATWEQLQAYAATYTGEEAAPTFADVIMVPAFGPGMDSIVDLSAGDAGFACVAQVDGGVAGVALGPSFEVAAP
jgi:pyrimidine-specific ribonucleoside hydrolase